MVTRCDLQHISAHAEPAAKLLDVSRLAQRGAKEMARYEKLSGESVRLFLNGRSRIMVCPQEVMPKLVRDREAPSVLRLSGGNLDSIVEQTRAQRPQVLARDDRQVLMAGDRKHRHRRARDPMLDKDAPRESARVCRVRAFRPAGSARNRQQLLRSILFFGVHWHRVRTALDALRGELRRLEEAVLAFRICAAKKWHRGRLDVARSALQDTSSGPRGTRSERCSRLAQDAGRDRGSTKGAPMEADRDKEVFERVEEVRGREGGLSEQLERYRHSRDEYEKIFRRSRETTPSAPLERVRRQRSAGHLREAIDREH